MGDTQLIYASQPFGFNEVNLSGILLDARRCNKRDGITGALVCRHDAYLQLLEGPAEKVRATYQRIIRDDRHANVEELVNHAVTERMFGDWAMLHDPAKTWIWSQSDIAAGALDRATPDEITGFFLRLAETAAVDSQ